VSEPTPFAEAAICYTGDMLAPDQHKYTLQYYLDMARQLEDEGAHLLAIKDMAGLLKPLAAEVLVRELKQAVSIPIHLHTHDTSSHPGGYVSESQLTPESILSIVRWVPCRA
jgi:pyruvate carboxylase